VPIPRAVPQCGHGWKDRRGENFGIHGKCHDPIWPDPVEACDSKEQGLRLDEKTFRSMHNEDAMATEKLAEGIRKFNSDAQHLQQFALARVAETIG
jgi:transaldolase